MDLKKLFVYVPAAAEATWAQTYLTNGVPNDLCKTTYANKIVFLESSHRIVVKGNFYGTDPSDIQAIYNLLGGDTIAALKTKLGVTSEAADFATAIKDAIAAAVNALDTAADVTTASVSNGVVTLTAGIKEVDGVVAKGSGADITLAKVATTGAAEDVSVSYQGITANTVEAAITELKGNIVQTISSYEAADQAIITAFQNADTAIISSYEAGDRAVIAMLPGVTTDAASGITVTSSTDEAGKTTYTIHADQSIWEFMGTASATAATVATVLDAKYGEGEGQIHRAKEQGDVWAVTITDQSNNTILYAWDGTNWVQIGSAAGVSGVDTTASHGVALTNNASVVGVNVTPGSVADGDTSVITGGAAYTAIQTAEANAYAEAATKATEAQENAYAYTRNEVDSAYNTLYSYTTNEIAAEHAAAYAEAAAKASEAEDNAYAYAAGVADAIIASYEAADTAINQRIDNLDASYSGSEVLYTDKALYTYSATQTDGQLNNVTFTFDKTVMQNYVVDNLWEEYQAPSQG